MKRCVFCERRCWPLGSGVESTYGLIHTECLTVKIKLETVSKFFAELTAFLCSEEFRQLIGYFQNAAKK